MNAFTLAGCGIIACVLIVTVKQYKPEMAVTLTIAAGIVLLGALIISFTPLLGSITNAIGKAGAASGYFTVVIKAIGICLVTQLAADICRDAGESSIASKVEMGGKLSIVALSLPLFDDLLKLASNIISN